MKTIPLTQGKVALVDDVDHEWLSLFKWHALRRPKGLWHAARTVKKGGAKKRVYMHRVIVGALPDEEVDHRSGDGLDNRRGNIRRCTKQQNSRNRRRTLAGKTSRFHGVCWSESKRRWVVVICAGSKNDRGYARQLYVGVFRDEVEAARAYDRAAIEHFGDFAKTNFPQEKSA